MDWEAHLAAGLVARWARLTPSPEERLENVVRLLAAAALAVMAQGSAVAATASDTASGSTERMTSISVRRVSAQVLSGNGLGFGFSCAEGEYLAVLTPTRPSAMTVFNTTGAQLSFTRRVDEQAPVHEVWEVGAGRGGRGYMLTSAGPDRLHAAISGGQDKISVSVEGPEDIFFFPVARFRMELDRTRAACREEAAANTRR